MATGCLRRSEDLETWLRIDQRSLAYSAMRWCLQTWPQYLFI